MEKDKEDVQKIKSGFLKSEFWLSLLWIGYTLVQILPKTNEYEWYVTVPMMATSVLMVAFWIWKRNEIYTSDFSFNSAVKTFSGLKDFLIALVGEEKKIEKDKDKEE